MTPPSVHDSATACLEARHGAGVGTVEDCEIFNHTAAEVLIGAEGNPLIRRCRIHDGKKFGVSVQDKGQGKLLDCIIYAHAQAGVTINEGGAPVFSHCKINANGAEGIRVHPKALGLIENCDLTGNEAGAWFFRAGCRLRRRGNRQ
jgi:hypothetical protein